MVGFNRRFSPLVRHIRKELAGRSTPMVASYRVNAGFIRRDSWVQDPVEGGGRIIGEVCHFVDTLRFLTGSPVRSVQAACIQSDNAKLTSRDSLSITLSYQDGSVAAILYHALGNPAFPKRRWKLQQRAKSSIWMISINSKSSDLKRERIKAKQGKEFCRRNRRFRQGSRKRRACPIPFPEIVETTKVTFAVHKRSIPGE